jgi:hypothetical protein
MTLSFHGRSGFAEAPGYGQPITVYDPASRGASAYRASPVRSSLESGTNRRRRWIARRSRWATSQTGHRRTAKGATRETWGTGAGLSSLIPGPRGGGPPRGAGGGHRAQPPSAPRGLPGGGARRARPFDPRGRGSPARRRAPRDTGTSWSAGERRLRAAKLAGLATIPAVIREGDDTESLREALIENIHREDLSPWSWRPPSKRCSRTGAPRRRSWPSGSATRGPTWPTRSACCRSRRTSSGFWPMAGSRQGTPAPSSGSRMTRRSR